MMVCGRGSGRHILLWSLLLMSLLCWEAVVSAGCVRFEFPTAQNPNDEKPIVETTENQIANIVFNIDIHNCSDTAQVTVAISKMNQTTKLYEDFCKLQVNAGKADVFYEEDKCRGGESKGSYSLSKHVDRSDNTSWRWRGSFKEQGPPQIVQMLVRPRTTVTPPDKTSFTTTTRGPFSFTSPHDGEATQRSNEEAKESNSHIPVIVIAFFVVTTTCGAMLGICGFFLFRRCKERFSGHCRLGRRRDVTERQQGEDWQEHMHLQPAHSGTSPESGEGGSACYGMQQRPSPLPPNTVYKVPKEPSSYPVPPPPRPAFSS